MNLLAITGAVVGAVNPRVTVQLQFSEPPTTQPDYTRTTNYSAPVPAIAQVQPIPSGELSQESGINMGGASRRIYVYGSLQTVLRFNQDGGDLITLPDGTVYLTVNVEETWPGWCCVNARLQNGS
jgi:hypothetical protein